MNDFNVQNLLLLPIDVQKVHIYIINIIEINNLIIKKEYEEYV